MNKENVIKELQKLIEKAESFTVNKEFHQFVDHDKSVDVQYYFSQVVTFIDTITGIDRYFYTEAKKCIDASKRQGGICVMNVANLIGHLNFLRDAIENDWLVKLEQQVRGNDFINFLLQARKYLAEGKKMEASVISSSIFESIVRQIGYRNSISHKDLEQVINGLKANGRITKSQSAQFKYFSSIRNSALHAKWADFQVADIEKLNEGIEEIIRENFGGISADSPK